MAWRLLGDYSEPSILGVVAPVPICFALGLCVIKPNRRHRSIVAAVLGRLHDPLTVPAEPYRLTNE
jgi:hypothetical protein